MLDKHEINEIIAKSELNLMSHLEKVPPANDLEIIFKEFYKQLLKKKFLEAKIITKKQFETYFSELMQCFYPRTANFWQSEHSENKADKVYRKYKNIIFGVNNE